MALNNFSLGDVGGIFTSIREAITGEKIIDPNELKQLEFKLLELETGLLNKQAEINNTEAKSSNLFVAGWRPFIGWVCGVALAYAFIGQPILEWIVEWKGLDVEPPWIETEITMELVLAMLGLGSLRTFEKFKDVENNR